MYNVTVKIHIFLKRSKQMKKVLAIVLSIMMICAALPFAASAAVAKDDTAIDYLLNGEYSHLKYVADKDNFTTELRTYTALGLYDNAWDNLFTGSVDVSEAEAILLALIEKIDAEYNNETFEDVIKFLEGVNTVSGLVAKVDEYTGLIGLAESSEWSSYIGALGTIIEVANYGNQMYETFVEGYAAILSAQAASEYYGAFLDYLAENCENDAVKTAAANIKTNINQTYEEAIEELLAEIADQAGKDAVGYGIEIAMDAWTVTAAIKTGYNAVSGIAKKVFNTNDKYKYMSSLVILKDIELVTPAYVEDVLDEDVEAASDFAINVILTIRETGEDMLTNLGKVVEDAYVNKLLLKVDYSEIKTNSAIGAATLALLRDVIAADDLYVTYAPIAEISTQKDISIFNADGEIIGSLAAAKTGTALQEDYGYAAVYNSTLAGYVTVIIPFEPGVTIETTVVAAPASTDTNKTKMSFFERLIQAIKDVFAKLFSFGK